MDESMCPVCGSNDAVQSVATIVDSGTSTSVGGGVIFSLAASNQVAPFAAVSRTTSNLAKRLSPITITPGNVSAGAVSGLYGLFALVYAFIIREMVFGQIPDETWYGVAFTMVIFIVPGILLSLLTLSILLPIYRYSRPIARRNWMIKATRLHNARYCFRDDVVFDESEYGYPESYRTHVFS